MSVTLDIFQTYRRPRAVIARHMAGGVREDRALIYLMLSCVLIFVGQWPSLMRASYLDPDIPLDARLGGALMGWIVMAPLGLYFIAGVAHILARIFGGRGSWFTARVAIFWGLLAASPLWMLSGLTEGFIGESPATDLVAAIVLGVTLLFWGLGMWEAEWPARTDAAKTDKETAVPAERELG
ncbi:MAG: YIP1 family protein [Pseudomonadota bacterium]